MMGTDAFLGSFIEGNDEVKRRCLTMCDFGQEMGNEENDVPLYDQYNRGLVLTQESRPRMNLELEGNRCGLTGTIPSMEQGLAMGASPKPKALVLDLGNAGIGEEEKEMSLRRRGLKR